MNNRAIVLCAGLALCAAEASAQVPRVGVSRTSGLRDTTTNEVPRVTTSLVPQGPLGSPVVSFGGAVGGQAGPGTGSFNGAGTASAAPLAPPGTASGVVAGGGGTDVNVTNNTVNNVEFRTTAGGTFVPGYGPSGGVAYLPGSAGSEQSRGSDVRPPLSPAPDMGLEPKITHVEALDGLTYADTVQMQRTMRRFQLVDSVKVLSLSEREELRDKLLASPVSTGSQNILTRFLRQAELIQDRHVVVGVVPRKNMILIGVRSDEEL